MRNPEATVKIMSSDVAVVHIVNDTNLWITGATKKLLFDATQNIYIFISGGGYASNNTDATPKLRMLNPASVTGDKTG